VSLRKYSVLAAIVLLGACGDVCLSRGMKDVGSVSLSNWTELFRSLLTPWVVLGVILLIGFMSSYLTALSWADLTFVLPSTAVGYILMALLARFFLHENVTPKRWIGIALITVGVGFVTGGPSRTSPEPLDCRNPGADPAGDTA